MAARKDRGPPPEADHLAALAKMLREIDDQLAKDVPKRPKLAD